MNSNVMVDSKKGLENFPFYKHYIKRYNGEDVTLDCSISFNLNTKTTAYWSERRISMRWTVNGTDIQKGPRHELSFQVTKRGIWVDVHASLTIKLIRARDIGVYRCFRHLNYYKLQLGTSDFNLHVETTLVGIFSLNLIPQLIKILKRSVGDTISPSFYFFYHSKEDINDINADYTINDIPIGMYSQTKKKCSIASVWVIAGLKESFVRNLKTQSVTVDEVVPSLKMSSALFCLGTDMFGIHREVFYRRVQTARNTFTFYEIEHPFVFVVLPTYKYSILWNIDDGKLYNEIDRMVNNGTDLDTIQSKINVIHEFINANEKRGLVLINLFHGCVMIIIILGIFMVLHYSSTVYFKYVILKPTRNYLIPIPYRDEELLAIEDVGFDVFVSHAEDEYNFVTTILLPFLLENNYSVTYSRDEINCPPNQPIFHFYKETIPKSKKIIVVLSKHFAEDELCNHVQLELIILPLLYEKKIEPRNVLFIKYDKHAVLPVILRWNLEVETLSWHNHLSDAVKLRSVGHWLATGKCRI